MAIGAGSPQPHSQSFIRGDYNLAVSRITINHANIATHIQGASLGRTSARGRGVGRGDADALARRMVIQARVNAAERFDQRTTALVTSVVPIVRHDPRGGTEVGVGTTVEHGKWLEMGTDFHYIPPGRVVDKKGRPYLQHNPNSPRAPQREEWILERRHYNAVPHPGNEARHWMSDAVRAVLPGAVVRVRARR